MDDAIDRAMVLDLVERTIAPVVGETLARASTRAHCEKLGASGATLTGTQANALIDRVAKGMRVFVGTRRTDELVQQIRADLARARQVRR
jgi:hypothetical protein